LPFCFGEEMPRVGAEFIVKPAGEMRLIVQLKFKNRYILNVRYPFTKRVPTPTNPRCEVFISRARGFWGMGGSGDVRIWGYIGHLKAHLTS